MFDSRKFYENYNLPVIESYEKTLASIRDIMDETQGCTRCAGKKEFAAFFNHTARLILKLAELEKNLDDSYFLQKDIEELKKENNELYAELLPENYGSSYANPSYAVKLLGNDMGQLFSAFYVKYRGYIQLAYKHKIYKMEQYNRLFIKVFKSIQSGNMDYSTLKSFITGVETENLVRDCEVAFYESHDVNYRFYCSHAANGDIMDLRYLFKFGEYITENEIKTAQFLNSYSEEKLKVLTAAIADAYLEGFVREGKDRGIRSTIRIIYNIGQERILKELLKDYEKLGFNGHVHMAVSTDVNKQVDYDHRFDNALYMNEEYAALKEKAYEEAAENLSPVVSLYSGIMLFEKFGDQPFAPESKPECLKLSEEQSAVYRKHKNTLNQIWEKFMPQPQTSFCIVAFPTPAIGSRFEEIYDDTVKINMLDNKMFEDIQKHIIDALDMGEFIHIKGKEANLTDIKVRMHPLANPEKETNFVNCLADVNIPVGEVFTSPLLKDTNGILHLEETFLDGLKYVNLKLIFKDGYITSYSCNNFDNEEDNLKYVEENLLRTHKTLPIGEFAIGTNTYAYVTSRKYGIVDILPVLIVEKMGPHFAIGDTCFSWAEDYPIYNLNNGKEIIARDNEKSILRKNNPADAYTNVHTDITLPYDSLGLICAITKDGRNIDIIRNGRFVLPGTEKLNEPFIE